MTPPDRGDIAWTNFDPQAGHEQAKRRPALVLSPRSYNAASGLALVCPISTDAKGKRFEVPLAGGMHISGVVISDQIHSLDWRARRVEFCERAPNHVLEEVLAKLAAVLGL